MWRVEVVRGVESGGCERCGEWRLGKVWRVEVMRDGSGCWKMVVEYQYSV